MAPTEGPPPSAKSSGAGWGRGLLCRRARGVAAVVAPVAAVGRRVARRSGEPILPQWRPWRVPWGRVPWGGFEVVVAFLVLTVVVPTFAFQALVGSGFFTHVYGPDFPPPPA